MLGEEGVMPIVTRIWKELDVRIRKNTCVNTLHRAPGLDIVREPALKVWLQYVEAERRPAFRTDLPLPGPGLTPSSQIQSKIQKVTGELTARLTACSLTITV